jgi:hypothetical protein
VDLIPHPFSVRDSANADDVDIKDIFRFGVPRSSFLGERFQAMKITLGEPNQLFMLYEFGS